MENTLRHHGIKGMKWGVRRYQNADGSLTAEGLKRYGDEGSEHKKSTAKKVAIGATAVAGVVLTAYLVKKYGAKNAPEIAEKAEIGKSVVENLTKTTSVMSTPVRQLQAPKSSAISTSIETGKAAAEKIAKMVSPVSKQTSTVQPPPAYDFETLMKQNDDLLKKMLADLM